MNTQATAAPPTDPIMARLEDQIDWYDRKSVSNQRIYKRVKLVEIFSAAAIPILASLRVSVTPVLTGGLGVVIVVLEFLIHINKYQENWIFYRSTCESLKHEKYVYLAKAGPYSGSPNPHALLTDRIESLVSQEHAKWASVQQK
jgi:hypothetical protein